MPYHRSEEHTSELQSHSHLVCRLLLEKKKQTRSSGRLRGQNARPHPRLPAQLAQRLGPQHGRVLVAAGSRRRMVGSKRGGVEVISRHNVSLRGCRRTAVEAKRQGGAKVPSSMLSVCSIVYIILD